MQLSAITPIILTFNEEANIERSLDALRWASRIVVVDSGSTDKTAALVGRYANAVLFSRPFDCHANQWNYALTETGIDSEWVLILDADHIASDRLVKEIETVAPAPEVNGFRIDFIYCIDGHALRGSLYPSVTALFRRRSGRFVQDGHTQRIVCDGKVAPLHAKLLHDDRKSTERWLQSQARYMTLEAAKLKAAKWRDLDSIDKLRRLRIVAPAIVFFYCLLVRGLVLDGKAGLLYTLQRATAEAILSMILLRQDLKIARPPS